MNPDISGAWHGVLDTGSVRVKLAFRLAPGDGDGGEAVLSTTSAGDVTLPLALDGGRIRFDAADFDVAFDLALDAAGERLAGTCRHAHAAYPVSLARGRTPPGERSPRPQTPEPPFPYEAEAVAFDGADGTRRVGTLTRPTGAGPHPAMILSAWFGPTNRDQITAGHRPMKVWADLLTRAGLVTLRYDKRGMGASEGVFERATTGDLADDLTCALRFLRAQPGVDAARVGLMGHSEGGHISAEVAAADPSVAFCVMMTPSGVAEETTFETEMFRAAIAVGGAPTAPEVRVRLNRDLTEAGRSAATAKEAVARSRAVLTRAAEAGEFPRAQIERRAAMSASPWRRYWWNYDHTAALRRLTCPVLVVFAGLDLQTAPRWHAPAVRAALAAHPHAEIVELAGLNHFLQTARTGAPSEYGAIEETLAPAALAAVGGWILRALASP